MNIIMLFSYGYLLKPFKKAGVLIVTRYVGYCFILSPRSGLLQDESLWLESEEAEVLSVELDLTDRTDGIDALGGFSLSFGSTPTDAELLHSEQEYMTGRSQS